MSNTAKVTYLGDLRTEAIHLKSQNSILTDAPVDNLGKGEFFSPTDLVASAYLSCMFTIMGIVMKNHSFQAEVSGEVQKVMYENPRRIGELNAIIKIVGNLTDKQKALLEHTARHCPVAQSLNPEIVLNVNFEYF